MLRREAFRLLLFCAVSASLCGSTRRGFAESPRDAHGSNHVGVLAGFAPIHPGVFGGLFAYLTPETTLELDARSEFGVFTELSRKSVGLTLRSMVAGPGTLQLGVRGADTETGPAVAVWGEGGSNQWYARRREMLLDVGFGFRGEAGHIVVGVDPLTLGVPLGGTKWTTSGQVPSGQPKSPAEVRVATVYVGFAF